MLVSLLFRVQSLSDVITNINVLYVMTVKSITDLCIFAGYNTSETMYRFSEFCSQLWYRLASQSKRQWKHTYVYQGTKMLLRTGGHKRSFTKLDLAINMSLLLLFFLKWEWRCVTRTGIEIRVFKMGMEGQFQITAGKNIKLEVLVQSKQIGGFLTQSICSSHFIHDLEERSLDK